MPQAQAVGKQQSRSGLGIAFGRASGVEFLSLSTVTRVMSSPDKSSKSPAKSKAARERLAKALKANLARRKAGHSAKK